jgi:hypothetical protein
MCIANCTVRGQTTSRRRDVTAPPHASCRANATSSWYCYMFSTLQTRLCFGDRLTPLTKLLSTSRSFIQSIFSPVQKCCDKTALYISLNCLVTHGFCGVILLVDRGNLDSSDGMLPTIHTPPPCPLTRRLQPYPFCRRRTTRAT